MKFRYYFSNGEHVLVGDDGRDTSVSILDCRLQNYGFVVMWGSEYGGRGTRWTKQSAPWRSTETRKLTLGYRPSKKSIKHAVDNIHALTARSGTWQETTEMVQKLNRTLSRSSTARKAWRSAYVAHTAERKHRRGTRCALYRKKCIIFPAPTARNFLCGIKDGMPAHQTP
jgi:hypothetical protein